MKKPPALAQAMTPFPYAIETDRPLEDARAMMDRHDFHHLPVTEGGELVGVISDRDVEIATAVTHDTDPSLTVAAVYSSHPYVVDIGTPLEEVARAMAERHIGSTLVLRHGKLVGIVTYTDIARVLVELLRELSPPPDHSA